MYLYFDLVVARLHFRIGLLFLDTVGSVTNMPNYASVSGYLMQYTTYAGKSRVLIYSSSLSLVWI
jgi:hypothetical protein